MKRFSICSFILLYAVQLYSGSQIPGLVVEQDSSDHRVLIDVVHHVYSQVLQDFYHEIDNFSQKINDKFESVSDGAGISIDQFNEFCIQQFEVSRKNINRVSNNSINYYYQERKNLGIASNVGVTDPIARKLAQDINALEWDVIYDMQVALEKVQFVDHLDEISQNIKESVAEFKEQAAQDYAQRQAEASQASKMTKFKEFKIAGKDFLSRFQDAAKKECQEAVTRAIQDSINELGQAAVDIAFDKADQLGKQALSQLSKTLALQEIFGSDVLGEQIAAKFEQYSSEQLKGMFDKLPNFLQKQAFKIVGINEDEDLMVAGLKAVIRKQYPVKQKFDNLQVRQSTDLSDQEKRFVNNRMSKIAQALQKNFKVDKPVKIGLCTSGGGNRAMLVTLGFHLGAQDIGLLDSILYTAGVSGSTWTISSWSYLYASMGMSLQEFKDQVINGSISKSMLTVAGTSMPPMLDQNQQLIVGMNAACHFAYDQNISSIDLYGAFIGNYMLMPAGNKRLNVTWSSIADVIEKGDIPLPMGSAVSYKQGQKNNGKTEYYWYEVGPFEVGSDQIKAYVPVWAFGSKFNQGSPVTGYQGQAPEYPISYYQGVFGSAFAASINEVVDQKLINPQFKMLGESITLPVDTWIKNSLSEKTRDTRMYPATFHNYAQGIPGNPLENSTDIRLYDGAMNINFPIPVLMRPARDLDVIIVCDAAVDLASLQSAQLHCQRNGLKFPDVSKVTTKLLASTPITVLNDPRLENYDKDMITILYCPFIKNSSYSADFDPEICMSKGECATFNFKYSSDQANRVVELMRYNVQQVQSDIQAVLQALSK